MRTTALVLGLLVVAALALPQARAQSDYPSRAVTIVVPFPPGGTADALPRIVAETAVGSEVPVLLWRDGKEQTVQVKVAEKQALLMEADPVKRLEMAFALMEGELGVLQVEKKIKSRVKRQMEKTQREYYLNEQLKAIQKELGEGEEGRDEMAQLDERIKKTKLSKEAREKALAEAKNTGVATRPGDTALMRTP